jgi:hypothetical protein
VPAFSEHGDKNFLFLEGLFLPVAIDVPASVARFPRTPTASRHDAVPGKALIDTGARLTSVRRRVLDDIGALRVRSIRSRSASARFIHGLYIVRFAVESLDFNADPLDVTDLTMTDSRTTSSP